MPTTWTQRLQDVTFNALRLVTGAAFMTHGGQKLFGWFGAEQAAAPLLSFGTFLERFWPVGLAGLLEFFGGLLVALGLFTPQVAFVIAGEMAVTYFWRHWGFGERSIWWWANRGELALLYCYLWLFFWGHGSGSISLDAWLQRKKAARAP